MRFVSKLNEEEVVKSLRIAATSCYAQVLEIMCTKYGLTPPEQYVIMEYHEAGPGESLIP